jgi:hypothetical protein
LSIQLGLWFLAKSPFGPISPPNTRLPQTAHELRVALAALDVNFMVRPLKRVIDDQHAVEHTVLAH